MKNDKKMYSCEKPTNLGCLSISLCYSLWTNCCSSPQNSLGYSKLYENVNVCVQLSYPIYDAATFTQARWLLPKKMPPSAVEAAANNLTTPLPGDPGRWMLPDDNTGLNDFAAVLAHIDHMSQVISAYNLLQVSHFLFFQAGAICYRSFVGIL